MLCNETDPWMYLCVYAYAHQAMEKALAEEVGIHDFPKEPYFVDFLRDAPELTGDEPDDVDMEAPKVYEEVTKTIKQRIWWM